MMSSRVKFCAHARVVFIVSLLAVTASAPRAQGLTLGILLNQAFDRASQLLTQAESTGNFLEAQTAGRVQLLIESARQTYAKSLDLTASRLSAQQQQFMSGVKTLLDDAQNDALRSVNQIAQRAQAIANVIPFSDHFPQAMEISGTLIDPKVDSRVEISGNFFDSARGGYAPVLRIGEKSFSPVQATTTNLEFQLPIGFASSSPSALSHVSGVLEVPYREGCRWFFHCKRISQFHIGFDLLPNSPGTVVLQQTKLVDGRQDHDFVSHEYIQDSAQDDKEETHCDAPGDGWQVDQSTVAYHLTHEEGRKDHDWFDLGNQSSAAEACYRFKTLHKAWGTSGKLHFTLSYHAHRTVQEPRPLPEQSVSPSWSEQHVLATDPGSTWKLIFHRFDGKAFEFATAADTPYLRIETAGTSITLVTPP